MEQNIKYVSKEKYYRDKKVLLEIKKRKDSYKFISREELLFYKTNKDLLTN